VNGESLELAESLIAERSSKLDISKFEDGYEGRGEGIGGCQVEASANTER
jgi:non-homologous end joining protein Ku